MFTDVLIIGTGISGLSFAIKLAQNDPGISITLISKDQVSEGNTKYAQGGIAVVSDFEKDSFKKHIQDTLLAGDGTCDREVVKFVVEEGKDRLKELIKWGSQFDTQQENLHLVKEGGHSEKRVVHYKDHTGLHIQQVLVNKIKSFNNIKILENHTLVDLITDHHSKEKYKRCYGAYVISKVEESILKISSKITALCTGGAGSLYAHSTNPPIATGDGLGAAYRAKVHMDKLPYVQFHPTALYHKVNGNTFLITEAVRGAGGKLRNSLGECFMDNYDPRKELAPRDIVARAIQKEIQKQKEKFVYLDSCNIDSKTWKNRFPKIYQTCSKLDIHLPQDFIPVVPAAHYFCGGIKVNTKSESNLKGLYAIGECSATGLHGANRLASNSLLEALVFSHRAALDTIDSLKKKLPDSLFYEALPEWNGDSYSNSVEIKEIHQLRFRLQELMSLHVGIFKTTKGLKKADLEMIEIYKKIQKIYNQHKLTNGLCELRNMVSIAHLIIQQAQSITINKGVFFNQDYA
tara:strand:- start:1299 stop:2852 length:1554 start_codon:yes stop_codon:yes gene_type:complete